MISNKTTILCLGFWSPPLVRPRAIALSKTIPEMTKHDVQPVLMTYEKSERWDIDIPIETIPEFSPTGIWHLPILRTIAEYRYYRMLLARAKKLIAQYNISAVVSFANPQAANILGTMIRKHCDVKFIAHFSDPWYDNPYKTFSRLGALKVKWLEKIIVKNADYVVFTNDAIQSVVMKKYPSQWRAKTLVIPQAYNPDDYPKTKIKNNKFTFRYIGVCYKDRSPEFFFKTLRTTLDKDPTLANHFIVEFVGATNPYAGFSDEAMCTLIEKYSLQDIVRSLPAVPYRDSLALMSHSDALLVIDANFADTSARPSKLMDYAGSRTPIIGIAPHGGPIDEMLHGLSYKNFSYDEGDTLGQYIADLVTGKEKPKLDGTYLHQFNITETTKKLLNLCK